MTTNDPKAQFRTDLANIEGAVIPAGAPLQVEMIGPPGDGEATKKERRDNYISQLPEPQRLQQRVLWALRDTGTRYRQQSAEARTNINLQRPLGDAARKPYEKPSRETWAGMDAAAREAYVARAKALRRDPANHAFRAALGEQRYAAWDRKREVGKTLRVVKLATAFLRGRPYAIQEPNAASGAKSFMIAQQIITSANTTWWAPYTQDIRPVILTAVQSWLKGGTPVPLGESLAGCA